MYKYKKLLAPLNLTAMDDAVLKYASEISKMAKSEQAHFLHVKRPTEVPEEILLEYPQLLDPVVEHKTKKVEESVAKGFDGHKDTDSIYAVKEGKPIEVLLAEIIEKDIDLVLVGRKTDAAETRRLPVHLARKAPCSVLIVPEKSKYSFTNILVPADFSEFCADALEVAIEIAKTNGHSVIHCLHVFHLPLGYSKTGKSEAEFTDIMKKNAERDYQRFISKIDLKGIEVKPIFMLHEKPAKAIQQLVEDNQIDLLVLGTRGRSAAAGLLMGSVTENIILNTQVPILAVKKKGTGLTFLEVLLKYV